ncbi:ferrous iron transport protein B [Treponema sp. OMZ 906]|uniref:ferrous iron transport protein B n=1 Tax=Treponema sp. OMZ 906 TaxID=2563662 RepID=UPI0020A4365B|nr:ferrous iron transport protein B [Treponema sp. OMZ 906]UTC54471.1 ferrous iron transport protein B [Treponema sp. OMZ 906]
MKKITIALLGQPNSGKSTLFNGLTGANQHVGNWPGKTVEKKEGDFSHKGTDYTIVDLPGSYGLSAHSEEEVITREYIANGKADLVAIMADASQLNRSLFMLSDYAGIQVPVVLIMNMMDIAHQQGKMVDIDGLQKALNIPVIPIIAADKKEYASLYDFLEHRNGALLKDEVLKTLYEDTIGEKYRALETYIPKDGIGVFSQTWIISKLVEKDQKAIELVQTAVDATQFKNIESILQDIKDGNLYTGQCKFNWVDSLIKKYVTENRHTFTRSTFDRLATSKTWGKPIAVGIIIAGLIVSMLIGFPLMGIFWVAIPPLSGLLAKGLMLLGAANWIISLVCGAVMTAVTFAFMMVSYVFGVSLVFGFMEDVGYMARVSYVFDNTMSKLGLQGKAIMPFLVSFGCNIGGVTGSRIIDSWGQRVMTIALSWVVPCGATWGVVGVVSGAFFGKQAVFVVLSLFAVAFLHLLVTYRIFRKSLYKGDENLGMIMELPPYHKPHWKNLFASVLNKMGNVFKRALSVIVLISVVFWALAYTPDGNITNSIIYKIGMFIEPVTKIFGLPWQLFMAFVASAMGKESALGVLASLFTSSGIWNAVATRGTVDTAVLSNTMLAAISKPEALAFLFAFFFNMPCLMALAATAQETHSKKWTITIAVYYIFSALVIAAIAYHIGMLIF